MLEDSPRTFTNFNNLPKELRLEIWERALPSSRIVHLARKPLRNPSERHWWQQIRSDKRIGGQNGAIIDEEEYGDVPVEQEQRRINKGLAAARLLTRDDAYEGSMTRAHALSILREEEIQARQEREDAHPQVWELGRTAPHKLFGFASEWEIPVLLLVCWESYRVASKVYTKTFAAQGALPQTYFSYQHDILYLDVQTIGKGFRYSPNVSNEDQLAIVLKGAGMVVAEEFARVERLVVEAPMRGGYRQTPDDANLKEWLHTINQVFPNLKELTAVQRYRYEYMGHKQEYEYEDLRFMEFNIDNDGISRVNGYRMAEAVKPQPGPPRLAFPESLVAEATSEWEAKYPEGTKFALPKVEHKLLTSRYMEQKLLEAAEKVAKRERKGTWYINPADPTDFEESASDEMDEEEESLWDWY